MVGGEYVEWLSYRDIALLISIISHFLLPAFSFLLFDKCGDE